MNDFETQKIDPEQTRDNPAGESAGLSHPPKWGHLVVLAEAGAGSFGRVYRAWDEVLHRQVALKLLPGGSEDDLLAEARALAGIDHPHVIRVFGAEVHDGVPGLWMEYVEGVNLDTRIRESGQLKPRELAECGLQLAQAVAAVHKAGLLHRDIKPANIMQRSDGRIVLMDLGTGRRRDDTSKLSAGTPSYMAPEVLDYGSETPRSDIYGIGAVLMYLASGVLPLSRLQLDQVLGATENMDDADLAEMRPDLPAELSTIIDQCMAATPSQRPVTADAITGELATIVAQCGRATVRRRWSLAGAATLVVALVVAGTLMLGGGPILPNLETLDGTVSYVGYRNGVAQTLGSGSRLTSGEKLGITLELSDAAYVYILNRDDSGAVTVMYPFAGDMAEKLAGGKRHYLPGMRDLVRLGWTFNSRPGQETFVLIASRERLTEFERDLAGLPAVDIGGDLIVRPAGPATVASLMRGVSGVAGIALPSTDSRPANLATLVDLASGPRVSASSAVWIHEMTLRNPGS